MARSNERGIAASNGHTAEPKSQNEAAARLTAEPIAIDYRPSRGIHSLISNAGRYIPWEMLYDAERMQLHPDVLLPYEIYKSGVSTIKFKMRGNNTRSAEYAHKLLTKVWENHLDQVQNCYDFGWSALEPCYSMKRGYLKLDSFIELHPMDVWALTQGGRFSGVRLAGSTSLYKRSGEGMGGTDLWGAGKWPPKGIWLNHRPKYDRWYGRSQLAGAWRPWRRLAEPDGAEDVIDGGFYRFAYAGPTVRFPTDNFLKPGSTGNDEVDYDAARRLARQMGEQAKAGMAIGLPSDRDADGNYLWDFLWPQNGISIAPLLVYEENIQKQISRGVGTPPELFQASDVGSGWSGRKIPMMGFYNGQSRNARHLVWLLMVQVVMPMLVWNFGHGAWAEVVEVEVSMPPALSGEQPEQAQGGGPAPPQGGDQQQMQQPGQQQPEGIGELMQVVGGGDQQQELSLVGWDDWLDPGWYPHDDPDYWSVNVEGYTLAGDTASQYIQKMVTKGPRKGQTGWFNTKANKFMPAAWKGPTSAKPTQGKPAKGGGFTKAKAANAAPSAGMSPGQFKVPKGKKAQKAAKEHQAAVDQQVSEQEGYAKEAEAKKTEQLNKIGEANAKEMQSPDHPMNKFKGKLILANFGGGVVNVHTFKDGLSKSDHEAMDRVHSRAAKVMQLQGDTPKMNAQLGAAKWHREQAGKSSTPTPDPQPTAQPTAQPANPQTQQPTAAQFKPDDQTREYSKDDDLKHLKEDAIKTASLSSEQREAFKTYSSSNYRSVNGVSRGQKADKIGLVFQPDEIAKAQQAIQHIDAALEKAGDFKEPRTLYRGMSVPKETAAAMLAGFERAAKSGQPIGFGGYQSYTSDPSTMHYFSSTWDDKNEPIRFETIAKKGLRLGDDLSHAGNEKETLLGRKSNFKVHGIKDVMFKDNFGQMKKLKVIQMEQLQ